MVKLQSGEDSRVVFYFKNINDCNKFLYVFKDHWCNVRWESPIEKPEFLEMTDRQREELDEDPKERAEDNLMWGFCIEKDRNIRLNSSQLSFIDNFIKQV